MDALRVVVVAAVLAHGLCGQVGLVYFICPWSPSCSGDWVAGTILPTTPPVYPGSPSIVGGQYLNTPASPSLGGLAYDVTTGWIYFSNGPWLAMGSLSSASGTAGPPSGLFGPFRICGSGSGSGPITGMAVGQLPPPFGKALFITDGTCIAALAPAPPFDFRFSWRPLIPPPFAGFTGLEFDSLTGTIWACDAAGTSFNLSVGGGLIGPPLGLPPVAVPAGTIVGNILDRGVLPSGALFVTDGAYIHHVTGGPVVAPIPVNPGQLQPSSIVPLALGAAFSAQAMTFGAPPHASTPSCSIGLYLGITDPPVVGMPLSVRCSAISNLAPPGGTLPLFLFLDSVAVPGGIPLPTGQSWYLGSSPPPPLVTACGTAGQTTVMLATSIPAAAHGWALNIQAAVPACGILAVSNAIHVRVALP